MFFMASCRGTTYGICESEGSWWEKFKLIYQVKP